MKYVGSIFYYYIDFELVPSIEKKKVIYFTTVRPYPCLPAPHPIKRIVR